MHIFFEYCAFGVPYSFTNNKQEINIESERKSYFSQNK